MSTRPNLSRGAIPPDVMVHGSIANPDAFLTQANALGKRIGPVVPDMLMLSKIGVQGVLNLTSVEPINFQEPMSFSVFSDDQKGDAWILILRTSSRTAFEAALPKLGRLENDRGNAWSILTTPSPDQRLYINFLNDVVVITDSATTFAKKSAIIAFTKSGETRRI